MNILRLIATMDPASGGPCQGIRNSIPELKKLGVRNEVVCLDDPSSAFLKDDPFTVHAIGLRKGPWQYNANLISWLLKNFHRFDAVIIHGLWLYPSYAVNKAINLFKTQRKNNDEVFHIPKIFVMPHGMLDPYFQEAKGRKLKAIRNSWYWKLIEKHVVNNADGLLFTCEEELRLAHKPFGSYHPKTEINVGYGIKRPPAYSAKMKDAFLAACPSLNEAPYFLFLSRIHEKKGVDVLIKAYAFFLNKRTGQGNRLPKLVIAGPGADSTYGLKLRKLIDGEPGLFDNILFPGMLLGDAKWGAYYGCAAFILPSHQENFGIVVIESLACSKPVLISDKVNIWQEIEKAGAGIVGSDSVEGTLELIEVWDRMTNEEKNAMQLNARSLFEEKYTSAAAASTLLQAVSQ
ncbi:MAG: glycosyltransferase [Ginsengibacter sp.]